MRADFELHVFFVFKNLKDVHQVNKTLDEAINGCIKREKYKPTLSPFSPGEPLGP